MSYFYLPENLDLDAAFPAFSCEERDKLNYLIHLIYEQRALYKIKSDFVPLKALYLRKILRDHKFYRETLESAGIIECDYQFIKNSKSYGLRLTDRYREAGYKQIPCRTQKVNSKIKKWKAERKPTTPVHKFLFDKLQCLEIDYQQANTEIKKLDLEKQQANQITIDKIKNKDWYFVNDEYGRIHTNITILARNLRQFLSVENQNLQNIDLVNSQPLFLYLVLSSFLPEYVEEYTIRCALRSKLLEELDLYSQLVQQGKLYDFASKMYGKTNREEAKELIFREIFGPTLSKQFRDTFPTLSGMLQKIKGKDYRRVAWMMQRQESKFIISQVCGRLMKIIPDQFISTIHDSILTTPECAGIVSEVILDAFKNIGLKPTLKLE